MNQRRPRRFPQERRTGALLPDEQVPPADEISHPVMQYMLLTKNCLETRSNDEVREIRRHYFAMLWRAKWPIQ